MIQLVIALICPIVLTIVALYLKKYIKIDNIGKSGYITKKSIESKEAWIYAQIISPKIYLKMAVANFIIDFCVILVMLIGNNNYNMIIEVCNCIGFIFIFIPFWIIDNKIEDFQENFFDGENRNCESARWLKVVTFLIKEKNFSELDCALDPYAWKNLLNEEYFE